MKKKVENVQFVKHLLWRASSSAGHKSLIGAIIKPSSKETNEWFPVEFLRVTAQLLNEYKILFT